MIPFLNKFAYVSPCREQAVTPVPSGTWSNMQSMQFLSGGDVFVFAWGSALETFRAESLFGFFFFAIGFSFRFMTFGMIG